MSLTTQTADVFARDIAGIVAHSQLFPSSASDVFMRSAVRRHQEYADQWARAREQMSGLTVNVRRHVILALDELAAQRREIIGSTYYVETMDWLRMLHVPAIVGLFPHDLQAIADEFRDQQEAA